MHDSNYENIDQIRQLAEDAMAAAVSPEIYLAVRTPAQLRGILRPKPPCQQPDRDSSLASRLGLFNDGMLASVYDLGTYDDTP